MQVFLSHPMFSLYTMAQRRTGFFCHAAIILVIFTTMMIELPHPIHGERPTWTCILLCYATCMPLAAVQCASAIYW